MKNERMNILLCHNHYQHPGGEDSTYADEARVLESHGHNVIRYTMHNNDIREMGRAKLAAKRYLCTVKPDYYQRLSEASILSLSLQGGPMSAEEAESFGANPNVGSIVQVRYIDEAAKVAGRQTPDFAHYAPLLQRVVDRHLDGVR